MLPLLVALGVDNLGSGLFLPLTLVYATTVVGLPLAVAGVAVTVGTVVGLLVPPVAGRFVDRVGPRPVVLVSQLAQAAGTVCYGFAGGTGAVVVAACLLAAGQQLFYSSLFALLADVVGDRAKDHPFALVGMVRSACFGLGGLLAAWLLTVGALRVAVVVNAASFLVCAALLAFAVRAPHTPGGAGRGGRLERRFLVLVPATALIVLAVDFFVLGIPVYVLGLGGPTWLPGVLLALHTAVTSTCATLAVRATGRLPRTTVVAAGGVLVVVWCVLCACAALVPPGWLPVVLLVAALPLAAANVLGSRVNALAVDLAPAAGRGRHLAAFQYSFTVPGVVAPSVVALFSTAQWTPWAVVALSAAAGAVAFGRLGTRLPQEVLIPASGPAR